MVGIGGSMRSTTTLNDEGVLRLEGGIDRESVRPLIDAILEHSLEGGREFLRLYINSPGGDVDQGFALIDFLRWSPIPIHTTGMGLVASMGLLVLMAGQPGHRAIMPNCSLLSHRFATITGGNHADLIAARRQQDLVHRRILDHYRTCTRLHDDQAIERDLLQSTDRWLAPEEAVAYGIVDRVWAPAAGDTM
jgi:ATP-dependent Clp protease protease subunit